MRYTPPHQPRPSFCPAEHLQQPHAGRERAVAGRALLQERHRQILEESGAAVSAGSLASVTSPLFPPFPSPTARLYPLLCCLVHTVSVRRF